ncbi:MAG: hypothetical protein CL910_14615, partial [Deltaproteobacteria bacterium]|nr:hypothetical protein [Deltaproteobacteria bacterium]
LAELARLIESGDHDAVSATISAARELLADDGSSAVEDGGNARSGGGNPEIQAAQEAATKE